MFILGHTPTAQTSTSANADWRNTVRNLSRTESRNAPPVEARLMTEDKAELIIQSETTNSDLKPPPLHLPLDYGEHTDRR